MKYSTKQADFNHTNWKIHDSENDNEYWLLWSLTSEILCRAYHTLNQKLITRSAWKFAAINISSQAVNWCQNHLQNWLTKNKRYFQSTLPSLKEELSTGSLKFARKFLEKTQPRVFVTRSSRKPTPIKKTTRKNNASDKTTRYSFFSFSLFPLFFSILCSSTFSFLSFFFFFLSFYHPTNCNSAAR